ncbi:MAG: 50S ribosomal protein L1 [Patescibacteria group bacterium]|nr:50S ribosomal protein L1 [Patescibacteria group bacterium]MDD4304472.1 50S ribosomal protein L1 [Patescibacteria group bacterium]MDD4694832.1 50S ribosomal protein L1 [Patescibacteria group bacterium]
MSNQSKRMKALKEKVDRNKVYGLEEAVQLIKETSTVKFDASVEVHIGLGIDPKKGDQIIRSSVVLPNGNGKIKRIIAFTTKLDEAKKAGADIIGDEDYISKIKKEGKCDFDVAVATPEMMPKLAEIAKILGQKGLMPNPKSGTIGPDVTKMIEELKKGKESFKNDDSGNVHVAVGKISFEDKKIIENIQAFVETVKKIKPVSIKGTYIKNIYISSSMGPGIKVSM